MLSYISNFLWNNYYILQIMNSNNPNPRNSPIPSTPNFTPNPNFSMYPQNWENHFNPNFPIHPNQINQTHFQPNQNHVPHPNPQTHFQNTVTHSNIPQFANPRNQNFPRIAYNPNLIRPQNAPPIPQHSVTSSNTLTSSMLEDSEQQSEMQNPENLPFTDQRRIKYEIQKINEEIKFYKDMLENDDFSCFLYDSSSSSSSSSSSDSDCGLGFGSNLGFASFNSNLCAFNPGSSSGLGLGSGLFDGKMSDFEQGAGSSSGLGLGSGLFDGKMPGFGQGMGLGSGSLDWKMACFDKSTGSRFGKDLFKPKFGRFQRDRSEERRQRRRRKVNRKICDLCMDGSIYAAGLLVMAMLNPEPKSRSRAPARARTRKRKQRKIQ